ncbi:DNA-directed RNA polymerase I subunit rpa2 [Bonamia ostreae]|uniref:DNA-directed RNA polymerase I subunit rpa2 n=1 Tax=Bonamia ostreae TaxID=126728 RepID=A0ABV2ANA5_9EUKA
MSRFDDLNPSQFGGFGENAEKSRIDSFLGNSPLTSPESKSINRTALQQSVIPVSIKQLLDAQEPTGNSTFKIDNKEISNVKIVGQIEKINVQTTHNEYLVEDGTGRMNIKIWKEMSEEQVPKDDGISVGMYVIVFGRVQFFNGTRKITSQKLVPVTDYNILSYHILETVYVHKYNTTHQKNIPNDANTTPNQNGNNQNIANNDVSTNSLFEENEQLTFEQKEILNFYKKDQSESGPHISEAFKAFPQFTQNSIKENVNFMVMEGLLYGTIDDDHLKPT